MWLVILFLLMELGLAILLVFFFRKTAHKAVSEVRKRQKEAEAAIRARKGALLQKEQKHTLSERRVSEIVELYELTKKVSTSLEFREVFAILHQVLHANFSFEKGYLFLLGKDGSGQDSRIERIYVFPSSGDSFSKEQAPLKTEAKEIPYLEEILGETERKEAFQGRSFPFTAIPLWVKRERIAVLVCERLVPEDMEKFTILSRQFALAIQKVKLYERLQELAITDGLTRLYSRRYFLERFHEELLRSKRHHLSLSFLMADIDHFKQKNDRYGHLVGDVILRDVAALLKANIREIDLVGRYGGEEFSIALPDTGRADALQVADRIRSAVEKKTFTAYDEVTRVTLSIGVGAYPEDGEEAVDLIEAADSALYLAKQSGRNRIASRMEH